MAVYIYGLKCPLSGEIRYVGKSTDPKRRLKSHIGSASRNEYSHHTSRWIRKVLSAGELPELLILHEVAANEVWQDEERRVIRTLIDAGSNLTNSTAGGEGLDYINEAEKATYLLNLSAAMKEIWSRPERREEARQRSLNAWSNPDIRERRIDSLRRFYDDPEMRLRAAEISREVSARPDVAAKRSASVTASWVGADDRKLEIALGEHNLKLSVSAKARWADPDKRQAALVATNSEAARAKKSQRAIERATPEYRAMMAEKTRLSWEKRRQKSAAQNSNSQAA